VFGRSVGAIAVVAVAITTLAACAGSSKPKTDSGAGSGAVTFAGLTVANPTDTAHKPQVTGSSSDTPAKLEYKDLVVGTGAAATPTSTVTVQYDGLVYPTGKQFQASWDGNGAIPFSLQQVVPGFTQGIGGTTDVPPMKAGGRRILVLPAALGYPQGQADAGIPPNTPIVFIVDLIKVG